MLSPPPPETIKTRGSQAQHPTIDPDIVVLRRSGAILPMCKIYTTLLENYATPNIGNCPPLFYQLDLLKKKAAIEGLNLIPRYKFAFASGEIDPTKISF